MRTGLTLMALGAGEQAAGAFLFVGLMAVRYHMKD